MDALSEHHFEKLVLFTLVGSSLAMGISIMKFCVQENGSVYTVLYTGSSYSVAIVGPFSPPRWIMTTMTRITFLLFLAIVYCQRLRRYLEFD